MKFYTKRMIKFGLIGLVFLLCIIIKHKTEDSHLEVEKNIVSHKSNYWVYMRNNASINITNSSFTFHDKHGISKQKYQALWPRLENEVEKEDRIVKQLSNEYQPTLLTTKRTIVIVNGPNDAQSRLHSENCPIQECIFTKDQTVMETADAVIYFSSVGHWNYCRPSNQIWILFQLESAQNAYVSKTLNHLVNWTATYRRDSVLVTPYAKFVHFDNFTSLPNEPARNYAKDKTKLVAWFVSNCRTRNGRSSYVSELQKHIAVDIYGGCGNKTCRRGIHKNRDEDLCFGMLNTDYKFYLAFENSNCKDYITEKLYWNALQNDILPIVMGARPDDYKAVAPPNSYIHVDDFASPKDLAAYLYELDNNDNKYNSYFRWKGTGEFINTKFWCRLCSMVHAANGGQGFSMVYNDLQSWWSGQDICIEPEQGMRWATWRGKSYSEASLVTTVSKTEFAVNTAHQCGYMSRDNNNNSLMPMYIFWVILFLVVLVILILFTLICIFSAKLDNYNYMKTN